MWYNSNRLILKGSALLEAEKRLFSSAIAMAVAVSTFGTSYIAFATDETTENKTYAIIAESNQVPVSINSGYIDIDGLVYSNCGVEASAEIDNQGDRFDVDYCVTNFSQQFMTFDDDVKSHENDYSYCGNINEVSAYGLSDLMSYSYKLSIGEMFGANENVTINGAVVGNLSEETDSVIFSSNGNITINVDTLDFDGIIYAPNGTVTVNANKVDVYGVIIAQEVKISCSSCEVTSDADIFGEYDMAFYTLDQPPVDIDIMAAGSSGSNSSWYYNTGTAVQLKASYSKYNLLNVVKKGDIIYEERSGSYSAITGHIGCVENIYYLPYGSYKTYKYNIRIIEAIGAGVCRSILDDTRCDDNDTVLLRYRYSISSSDMTKIINFLVGQLGKKYKMGRLLTEDVRGESYNEPDWYCSELVWAAYKYVGLDIEDGNVGYITPGDILDSGNTKRISYK